GTARRYDRAYWQFGWGLDHRLWRRAEARHESGYRRVDTAAMTKLIELRGITKVFGTGKNAFRALRGVDFHVDHGDFISVMGASGSGKSTMMNILGCLDVPTSGEYYFMGQAVQNFNQDQRALLRRR